MRKRWSPLVAALCLVAVPGPARAGGAMLDFDQDFYVPGDVVRASSSVWLKSSLGRLEDGPYFAYLHGADGDYPPPLPQGALRVAPVEIVERPTGEHGDASTEFVMPAVAPGRYAVTFCNDPCTKMLGDVMSTEVVVASSDAEGRIVMVQEHLRFRLRSLHARVRNYVLGPDAKSLHSRIGALEEEVARLGDAVHALEAGARRPSPAPSEGGSSALPSLLVFAVPAVALGVVMGRRSRRAV